MVLQVTKLRKYKIWEPQSPALYSNGFELLSDWLSQLLNSQSEDSSEQLLYRAGLWELNHLNYLNFFTCS